MAQDVRAVLITGLRNIHAIENQAIETLERQAERLKNYPELEARIRQHAEESRDQRDKVEGCLERLGTSRSSLKDTMQKLTGNMAAMLHAPAGDEVLKNTFATFAVEHFEIASYRSLITMAKKANEPEIARVCEGILQQEVDTARWLDEHLPGITDRYLELEATPGATAKH